MYLADGDDGLEQSAAVQGAPLAVGHGLGPVPDDHMVMELRVTRAAVVVGERGGHHPLDVLLDDAVLAGTGVKEVPFRVGQRVVDGAHVARGR